MTKRAAAADGKGGITRNRHVVPKNTAFLVVDVQYYSAFAGEGEWAHINPDHIPQDMAYYFDRVKSMVLPNIRRLQEAFRRAEAEVMYTVIESLTKDGRDRSLDYKISGLHAAKGSREARVPEDIQPAEDEITFPKTASSVFNSTNIDYVLRNLEVDYLVIAGLVTDQCVESAVRDACDRGFLVTLVTDACATYTQERHDASLRAIRGYCRQVTTEDMLAELINLAKSSYHVPEIT
jgi:ureidoacrylate peracid hydrolase